MTVNIISMIFSKSYFTISEASMIARYAEFKIAGIFEDDEKYVFGPCLELPTDCHIITVANGLHYTVYSPLNRTAWSRNCARVLGRPVSIDLNKSRLD